MNIVQVAPSWRELVPWTDKRGRLHPLRAGTLCVLVAPALYLLGRWWFGMLGPRATNAAIHSTGYYAVWILVATLLVTPAKAVLAWPNVVVIRRMLGNAALCYAALHLVLYASDQNWRLGTIVHEILVRFYLTIGCVTLLGLVVLGLTSTDGWIRALGRRWKRLHRIIYGLGVLALIHYVLQSKLDVSQALLAAGVFSWVMLWRALPAGHDRSFWPLAGLSVVSAVLTLGYEYCWYRFGTRVNPLRVVLSEADVEFGLHPAAQVLFLGALVSGVAALRRIATTAFGQGPFFVMGIYALGAFVDDLAAVFMGWPLNNQPDQSSAVAIDLLWVMILMLLGAARWKLRDRWHRHVLDLIWVGCMVDQVMMIDADSRRLGSGCAGLIVAAAILLSRVTWRISRGATLMLIPVSLLLVYEALSLL